MKLIEDLLEKIPLLSFEDDVSQHYKNKKIFITGACGSIGLTLAEHLQKIGAKIDGIDHNEGEVYQHPWCGLGDFSEIDLAADYAVVFHCAAYKHVDLGEKNVRAFYTNNDLKSYQFAKDLGENLPDTKLVLLSTDKAAGDSIMGYSKRAAERHFTNHGGVAIRLVNCAWSRGSLLDRWHKESPPWIGPKEVERYFIQLEDAVEVLLRIPLMPESCVYTVQNIPSFKLGDLAEHWNKLKFPKNFEERPLRPGEVMAEKLCSETETIVPTNYHHIGRIKSVPKPNT